MIYFFLPQSEPVNVAALSFQILPLLTRLLVLLNSTMEAIENILKDYPVYTQDGWKPEQVGEVPFLLLTVGFSISMFFLEHYLDHRQHFLFKTVKEIPVDLKGHVSEVEFTKSQTYNSDKSAFGLFESSITFFEGVALVFLGYLPYAWDVSRKFCESYNIYAPDNSPIYKEVVITAIFMMVMMLHDTIFGLPFSIYKTFVIEQKHGFNKSTFGLFLKDKLLSLGLQVLIGSPIISVVVYLIRLGGPHFYFYVWVFLCVVSLIMMTIYPTLIAPLFNKYTKLDQGELYDKIAALAKQVSFPLTQIFLVDGSKRSGHSNAYFYGFFNVGFLFCYLHRIPSHKVSYVTNLSFVLLMSVLPFSCYFPPTESAHCVVRHSHQAGQFTHT